MMPNLAFSSVSTQPLWSMDSLEDVVLLQIAVLWQDLLKRDVEEARKDRGGEDPEDIRPAHGWQRRGGGCMDITPY